MGNLYFEQENNLNNRVEIIRNKINNILNSINDENYRNTFYIHLYGVSNFAALLATRRGLNEELAYISGLMHDIALLTSNDYENHCRNGAQIAKEILEDTELFSEDETNIITSAILYHTDFEEYTESLYDELLKDADIIQPFFNDIPEPAWQPAKPRLEKMMIELNIPLGIIK